jgi:pimeloyl-ACP methyl ester carboxylesterase
VTAAHAGVATRPFRTGEVAVVETGDGPTVGYLHGFVGNPGVHPFLGALAGQGCHVVAPSLPGFTGSTALDDLRTLYDWVVAASELVDVAGLTGHPVVASSVGAMLALEVAAVRPEAFSHLVVIAPLGLWDPEDPLADPFATTLSAQRALLTADPSVTAPFFDDDPERDPSELIEDGVVRYLTRTAAAQLVWPIPEFGFTTRAHRVRCPVTLVWGGADRLNPVSYLDRWARLLPDVVGTNVIDGAGHLAEWDRPEAVAAVVAEAGLRVGTA